MNLFSVEVEPDKKLVKKHKNGKLNVAGTVRAVVEAMPSGSMFSSSTIYGYLVDELGTGHVSSNKIQAGLNYAERNGEVTREYADYYRKGSLS